MRQSQLFTKTTKEMPHDEVSKNAELLIKAGFVDKLFAGVYTMLPLGLRSLQKIEKIIREEMDKIGGQEILMSGLQPKEVWETTGRWDTLDVLFKLKGGDKDYALGPTHEEVITPLLKKFIFSYKELPRAVYQIQTKFRNEPRAKSGVLRGREFRMKDLYSFHRDQADLDAYYEIAKTAYTAVFKRCGLGDRTYLVYASGGSFSKYSHEYQTITSSGEDTIYICDKCRVGVNKEILADLNSSCPECKQPNLREEKAIEVGNIFKLGTRFSEPFQLQYADEDGTKKPVIMGCYGIGSSRLLGTIAEVLNDEQGMLWPEEVAPYKVHLVSLLNDPEQIKEADALYAQLQSSGLEVLYDDRVEVRAGQKFAESDLIGIPYRIVISAKTLQNNVVELKKRNEKDAKLISRDEALNILAPEAHSPLVRTL